MFTGNKISLGLFDERFGLFVRRECEFSYVGKVPTQLFGRIVPCTKPQHIEEAIAADGIVGIITLDDLKSLVPMTLGLAISDNPLRSAFALQAHVSAIEGFQWERFESKIHPTAVIHAGAYIARHDVQIGEGTIVHPNAVILERSIIGNNCSIGPGSVIATEAFEVDTFSELYKIVPQSGGVYIADHVDVQAKCTVVRSTFGGFTTLGEGTKLDCQVHFAHDCTTGRNVRIAAGAEISGRVNIGDRAFIGPNASISNGITIEDDAKVTIGAVVTRHVLKGETVSGNFAVSHNKWIAFMRTVR